ncbi:transcription antitermination factor NusB [Mycoplasma tauri]|uniref:Transcription antitermination protein NusB n=1 Tax=Mycoplasma tauri TaxID=547987 RepID=A0A953NG81_9MOLU|nr:transcription antitermination factor NusB [Mycoplasma tauri]MBZ4195116.1 transcription antitermination protein NusB [Mycoplasma tauri]MBZ4203762.1 transcription antitermination protein NusB [Mycoplasma tauri]MBZ4218182.1 transcription antitermination protein NusB [Mycoplasma tauri]MBZ4226840.1 transcription antitermination protein NusB [Mycoplasma tauri]QSB07730.1 transcription antitermination protein NusB [Mycoplasma tauri]
MKPRRKFRTEIINVIYRYELIKAEISINEVFELNNEIDAEQLDQIEKIAKNYEYYKRTISSFFNKNINWDKVSPLIRAILINATHELLTISPRIVINEAIEITKIYFDTEANLYKMVNAILQNIYKHFVINEVISMSK